MSQSEESYKICIIGNSSVGKTSLISQYLKGFISENEKPTVGASYYSFTYTQRGKQLKFSMWDTAGQEKYRSMVGLYYRQAIGIILVYDITNKESFDDIPSWLGELRKTIPNAEVIVVGNKIDKEDQRKVKKTQGENFATENGCMFDECSALTNQNVSEMFKKFLDSLNIEAFEKMNSNQQNETKIDKMNQPQSESCC